MTQLLKLYFLSASLALAGIASAQAQLTALESVQVSANGDTMSFKTSLDRGELFLLKASGAVVLGQETLDAE